MDKNESSLEKIARMQKRLEKLQQFHDSLSNFGQGSAATTITNYHDSKRLKNYGDNTDNDVYHNVDRLHDYYDDVDFDSNASGTSTNFSDYTPSNCSNDQDVLRTVYNSTLAASETLVKVKRFRRIVTGIKVLLIVFKPFINNKFIVAKTKLYMKRALFFVGLYNTLSFLLYLCEK